MIIVIFGLPGSGKSFLSKKLAKKINAHHISSDVIRKQLVSTPTYSHDEKLLIYKKMFDIMYDYVYRKNHLILDGTFYKASIRDNFAIETNRLGKDIKFIEVRADEELIKKRLSKTREYSDATIEIYEKIAQEFEHFRKEHLIVHSTDNNIDELLEQVETYLAVESKPA